MTTFPPGSVIGIFGGGQLGKMTALAAAQLGYESHIYCPQEDSPAFQVTSRYTVAPYHDLQALEHFVKDVDVVTFEFENIPSKTVEFVQKHVSVHPGWEVLYLSQNRLREKCFIQKLGIATTEFCEVRSLDDLRKGIADLKGPSILKTTELGYDGKGQYRVEGNHDLEAIWSQFGQDVGILEKVVPFEKEVSVVLARNVEGHSLSFPVVENVHKNGILDVTIAPAKIDSKIARHAQDIAIKIAEAVDLVGLLAVECFLTGEGELLVNEIAPRPHNSGHWTLDGCATSQFEQFVRAVCGLPFGSVAVHSPIRMQNLLGDAVMQWHKYLNDSDAKLHLYGKREHKPGRKMGHVNFITPPHPFS